MDQATLLELLHYDPETGKFTWKVDVARNVKAGSQAGHLGVQGYVRIAINKKRYAAHRLAWLFVTGSWPTHVIDHINRKKNDNRFENLRDVTPAANSHNTPPAVPKLTRGGKWLAGVRANQVFHYLGTFSTYAEATRAIAKAKATLHTPVPGKTERNSPCAPPP
jgi:hypothetical protein